MQVFILYCIVYAFFSLIMQLNEKQDHICSHFLALTTTDGTIGATDVFFEGVVDGATFAFVSLGGWLI